MANPLTPDELRQLAEWLHDGDLQAFRDDLERRAALPEHNKTQHLIRADIAALDDMLGGLYDLQVEANLMGPGATPRPSEHGG